MTMKTWNFCFGKTNLVTGDQSDSETVIPWAKLPNSSDTKMVRSHSSGVRSKTEKYDTGWLAHVNFNVLPNVSRLLWVVAAKMKTVKIGATQFNCISRSCFRAHVGEFHDAAQAPCGFAQTTLNWSSRGELPSAWTTGQNKVLTNTMSERTAKVHEREFVM